MSYLKKKSTFYNKKVKHLQFSCFSIVVQYLPLKLQAPNATHFKHNLLWQHIYVIFWLIVTSMSYVSTIHCTHKIFSSWDMCRERDLYVLSLEERFFSNTLAIFVLKYFYKSFPDSYNSDAIFPQRTLQMYVVNFKLLSNIFLLFKSL